jgi:hypothetical protein
MIVAPILDYLFSMHGEFVRCLCIFDGPSPSPVSQRLVRRFQFPENLFVGLCSSTLVIFVNWLLDPNNLF